MTTIPTVGFNVETVTYKNVKFNVWVSPSNYYSLPIYIVFFWSGGGGEGKEGGTEREREIQLAKTKRRGGGGHIYGGVAFPSKRN